MPCSVFFSVSMVVGAPRTRILSDIFVNSSRTESYLANLEDKNPVCFPFPTVQKPFVQVLLYGNGIMRKSTIPLKSPISRIVLKLEKSIVSKHRFVGRIGNASNFKTSSSISFLDKPRQTETRKEMCGASHSFCRCFEHISDSFACPLFQTVKTSTYQKKRIVLEIWNHFFTHYDDIEPEESS